jgi:hypothetical protein
MSSHLNRNLENTGIGILHSRTLDEYHLYTLCALVSGIESHGMRRRTENPALMQVTNLHHAGE